jgi:hypothetical protein
MQVTINGASWFFTFSTEEPLEVVDLAVAELSASSRKPAHTKIIAALASARTAYDASKAAEAAALAEAEAIAEAPEVEEPE